MKLEKFAIGMVVKVSLQKMKDVAMGVVAFKMRHAAIAVKMLSIALSADGRPSSHNMCTKKITKHGFLSSISYKCDRPDFKDGLCYQHHAKAVEKSKHWGERNNYRSATEQEFRIGKSMKLKCSNQHILYRQRNGIIQMYSSKTNTWDNTILILNHTHFCVKSFDR